MSREMLIKRFLSFYAVLIVQTELVDPNYWDSEGLIVALASHLAQDKVVALATDTIFGLVGRAASCKALESIAAIKGRPSSISMPVIIGDVAQLDSLVSPDDLPPSTIELLLKDVWPGPLTVVVPLREGRLCDPFFAGGTLGVRLPDNERLRALANKVGPLVATSANLHGLPTAQSGREAFDELASRGSEYGLSLILDEKASENAPSSVVLLSKSGCRIIREGAISSSLISDVFGLVC